MFLDYLALVMLLMGLTLTFYTFIYIHEIPHKIAKQREHPQEEAINVAGWLSLFTLHAIWPIVFIWAVSYKKPSHPAASPLPPAAPEGDQARRLAELEDRLRKLEAAK
jgi:Protein of unknown function (DUF3302)